MLLKFLVNTTTSLKRA